MSTFIFLAVTALIIHSLNRVADTKAALESSLISAKATKVQSEKTAASKDSLRRLQRRVRKLEKLLEAHAPDVLNERVEVLETIVTDADYEFDQEFKKLRVVR